jgi:Mrp family chromosome partitioning ATPase
MVLARRADGIILVLAAERTRAPVVEQARKIIEANKSRLLGVVMNRRRHHIPKFLYRLL